MNGVSHSASLAAWGVIMAASFAAAVVDARCWRIPNALSFPLLVAGLIVASASRGLSGAGDSALGCLLMATPFLLLFLFAGGGAGDAKFMGAVGAWLGSHNGLVTLLFVLVCGAVIGLLFSVVRGRAKQVRQNLLNAISISIVTAAAGGQPRRFSELLPPVQQQLKMPYGLAICTGVWLSAFWTLVCK